MSRQNQPRTDVYTRVTAKIITGLENGIRPWQKPWNAEHASGRITRPLRANGKAYRGINVLLLWSEAIDKGYAASTWMTYFIAEQIDGLTADFTAKVEPPPAVERMSAPRECERASITAGFTIRVSQKVSGHYGLEPSQAGCAKSAGSTLR